MRTALAPKAFGPGCGWPACEAVAFSGVAKARVLKRRMVSDRDINHRDTREADSLANYVRNRRALFGCRVYESNETKLSHRWRERALLRSTSVS